MNKLPRVFVNPIDKKIKNNIDSSNVRNDDFDPTSTLTLENKIKNIFNSPNYVYKTNVTIKTNEEIKDYTIIGRTNKELISKDNLLIPINKIIDIKIKD